jgi:hAT family C-terminal dimerisation region
MVILDNSTRWNSTFLSIKRALDLRERIDTFCFTYRSEIEKDRLTETDWQQLQEITEGLYPFHEVTKYLEGLAKYGHHGAIWEALPALTILLGKMEKGLEMAQATRGNRNPLAIAYQNAWDKLKKYYSLTDNAHSIFAAAVLLHPSYRKRYFDRYWFGEEAEWKELMISHVKKVWEKEYKPHLALLPQQESRPPTLMEEHLRAIQETPGQGNDEFDSYINSIPVTFNTPEAIIPWILGIENMWPGIKQQALDLLSIPAMSAELERVFSQTKLTVTPTRNRLSPDTIEVLELLRHWWVNNIITQERGGGGRQHRKRKIVEGGEALNTMENGSDVDVEV